METGHGCYFAGRYHKENIPLPWGELQPILGYSEGLLACLLQRKLGLGCWCKRTTFTTPISANNCSLFQALNIFSQSTYLLLPSTHVPIGQIVCMCMHMYCTCTNRESGREHTIIWHSLPLMIPPPPIKTNYNCYWKSNNRTLSSPTQVFWTPFPPFI